jgi:hypothetical protein
VNFHIVKLEMNSSPISLSLGSFGPTLGPLPMFWANSCLHSRNYSLAHYPQVGQRKHQQQFTGVLGQPPVTHLATPELTLDHPKRMLHFGADTGFGLVQRFALAQHNGNFPVHASVFIPCRQRPLLLIQAAGYGLASNRGH